MQDLRSLSPEILRTNYVPSAEERILIQNSLIPLHIERSLVLAADVERAQVALAALQLEQQAQHELLEAHRAMLTPMRRLIPDVLLEIFHHCHNDSRYAPMRLARVCRKWRELALATPTLWTAVALYGTLPTRNIVPFARACAKYSGSCPIKVLINFMNRRHDGEVVKRALFEALEILARHVDRWQTFEVLLHKAYRPDDGNFKLPDTAPRVEKLVLVIDVETSLQFSFLPNLRDLRLLLIPPQDIPLLLRCTMLQNLDIGGSSGALTLMDCWTILSNCPVIQKVNISSIKPDFTIFPKEDIILPQLHELRIGPFTPDPAPLVHCIKAPALRSLRLLVGKSMEFDSSSVTRLVKGCRPPLTILSLTNIDGASVASWLPLLPDLTSLTLQHASAVDLVISRLTERDDMGQYYCPKLLHLALRLCLFTGGLFVRFARERRNIAGGLRVLLKERQRHRLEEFSGFMIELHQVGEFSDQDLKDLYEMQTLGDVDAEKIEGPET